MMADITDSSTQPARKTAIVSRKREKERHLPRLVAVLGDISYSMAGVKLEALKRTYKQVVRQRPDALCLVYHDETYEITASDVTHLQVHGSTNMLEPLTVAWQENSTHIILITDGMPNWQSPDEIIAAVQAHRTTPIDTVGVHKGRMDYDPEFLSEISRLTGGTYYECGEPLRLPEIVTGLLLLKESNKGEEVIEL